jgi:hypothetical protein
VVGRGEGASVGAQAAGAAFASRRNGGDASQGAGVEEVGMVAPATTAGSPGPFAMASEAVQAEQRVVLGRTRRRRMRPPSSSLPLRWLPSSGPGRTASGSLPLGTAARMNPSQGGLVTAVDDDAVAVAVAVAVVVGVAVVLLGRRRRCDAFLL